MTSMSLSQAPRRILPSPSLNHLRAPTTSLNPSHPFAAHTHKAAAIPTTRQRKFPKLQLRPRAQFHTQIQIHPPHRTFTTTPSRPAAKPEAAVLSTEQYHKISDRYIDGLVAQLEEMQEEREDVDVEYSVRLVPSPSPFPIPTLSPSPCYFPQVQYHFLTSHPRPAS